MIHHGRYEYNFIFVQTVKVNKIRNIGDQWTLKPNMTHASHYISVNKVVINRCNVGLATVDESGGVTLTQPCPLTDLAWLSLITSS